MAKYNPGSKLFTGDEDLKEVLSTHPPLIHSLLTDVCNSVKRRGPLNYDCAPSPYLQKVCFRSCILGIIMLSESPLQGWQYLERAASMRLAEILDTFRVDRKGRQMGRVEMTYLPLHIAILLSVYPPPASPHLIGILRVLQLPCDRIERSYGVISPPPVLWFLYCLFFLERGKEVPRSFMEQLEGSPFHAVIEQWNLDVPIKPLVAAIVKYRIAKSTRTASTREEFFGIEADFPFEVIALDCVRRRMGLSGCLHCDALKVFHPAVVPPPDDFHALPNEFFDAWQSEVMGPEKVQAALEEIRTAPFTQWPVRKPPTGAEILKMVTAKREEEELLDDVLPIPQLFHLDWKDGVDAGFDAITGALPEDQPFEWEHMGGSRFKLSFGGKSETVEVSSTQGDEALWGLDAVVAAEQLLKPLFEIRVTRETMGDDGLTFLLMEAKWWDTYRTKKGKHFSKTFAPLTELRKVSG